MKITNLAKIICSQLRFRQSHRHENIQAPKIRQLGGFKFMHYIYVVWTFSVIPMILAGVMWSWIRETFHINGAWLLHVLLGRG